MFFRKIQGKTLEGVLWNAKQTFYDKENNYKNNFRNN